MTSLVAPIGWALLHFVWQGAIVARCLPSPHGRFGPRKRGTRWASAPCW